MQWFEVVPTAAVVSFVVTLALRWFDRPRPVLRLEARLTAQVGDGLSSGVGDGPTKTGRAALMNVGDGDAFDVKVFGSLCDPAIAAEPSNWGYIAPVIKAGEEIIVIVGANADPEKTLGAALIVTWSPRPRRWIRKSVRVGFDELGLAQLMPPGLLPVRQIPAQVRRTRSLEEKSPRAQLYRQKARFGDPPSKAE